MRTRDQIKEYQRGYYRLCVKVDRDGMRRQWRESKKRAKARKELYAKAA